MQGKSGAYLLWLAGATGVAGEDTGAGEDGVGVARGGFWDALTHAGKAWECSGITHVFTLEGIGSLE